MAKQRYSVPGLFPFVKLRPFAALREKLLEGYGFSDLRSDVMSGIIVAMVAIPLGMALAIASGVAPQYGLYTSIIGGTTIALLGGSRFQVSGPTAAFVVILAPIVQKFGFAGLLISGLMAGILLVVMGAARMGRLIQFIPHPVTTGFTAGIGVVIATLQLKDFFGLQVGAMPESFLGKVWALLRASPTWSWQEFLIGSLTLFFLLAWPKLNKKIPAPLVALSSVTVLSLFLHWRFPGFSVATIGSKFSFNVGGVVGHGIPNTPPLFKWPWMQPGPGGQPFKFSMTMLDALVPSAFAITMLGAIESLLSAVVSDGMAGTKHDPDAELVALGTGNILCPFFGGIAATGAIARTATNIRFGAKSPISAILHGVVVLLVVMLFAKYVSYLPMASLAALLILVAYNMSEVKHFVHVVKVAPQSDVAVLLLCFSLTVVFDMVVGVTVGVVLAALLFMSRMAATTQVLGVSGSDAEHPLQSGGIPREVVVYDIAGPLFFGAAEKAVGAMDEITDNIQAVILRMDGVPVMDITGLIAFESTVKKLIRRGRKVVLVGVKPQPATLLKKAGLLASVQVCKNIEQAIKTCRPAESAVVAD